MDIDTRMIAVGDDLNLVVETAGDGEPLVLLPGLGCSTLCFHLLIPRLVERGFSVIAINPRGIKGSTGPLDNLTVHELAADVAGVIETLDIAPAHIVGWAYGNRVARCVATDVSESVETVILLAAGGQVMPDPEIIAALSRLTTNAYATSEDRMGDLALALLAPSSDLALGEWLDIGLWPDATASQRQANNTTPVEEWWPGGSKPMLVVQGLHDRTAPPTNGYALCEEFGERVRLVDLPDAGHGLVVEQPESIAAAIDDWVRG